MLNPFVTLENTVIAVIMFHIYSTLYGVCLASSRETLLVLPKEKQEGNGRMPLILVVINQSYSREQLLGEGTKHQSLSVFTIMRQRV